MSSITNWEKAAAAATAAAAAATIAAAAATAATAAATAAAIKTNKIQFENV